MKKVGIVIISFVLIFTLIALISERQYDASPSIQALPHISEEGYFSEYILEHQNDFLKTQEIHSFNCNQLTLPAESDCELDSFDWLDDTSFETEIQVSEGGMYLIKMEYTSQTETHLPITFEMRVNDEIPYFYNRRLS